jgi:uncharacterized protein YihD (DUF1040 family)
MHFSQGVRPTIPKDTHPKFAELLQKCWHRDPAERPDFSQILEILQRLSKEVSFASSVLAQFLSIYQLIFHNFLQ